MALAGLKPIYNHYRMDFSALSMNQLINVAAKTHAMSGGNQCVPMTVRMLIGKSWGQGAQHSQSLYPLFMNIPGIRMAAPTTPYDAKACLTWLVEDPNPGILVEHRLLYFQRGPVPEGRLVSEFGRARTVRPGRDITIVGISYQNIEAIRAAAYLADEGIDAEVIDPIWLNPLDIDTIAESVERTGRLLTVDNSWVQCGAGAEIIARLHERGIRFLSRRLGFAETPCPTTPSLEKSFYPDAIAVANAAVDLLGVDQKPVFSPRDDLKVVEFKGPF
jgi:pyruvate/2-oxoglutarate/acetoin dehydrogenase E1 component